MIKKIKRIIKLIKLMTQIDKINLEIFQIDWYIGIEKNNNPVLLKRWERLHKQRENILNEVIIIYQENDI